MADSDPFRCRMYEDKFPEVDDLVIVMVNKVEAMGAYVSLLEYDEIDGMILLSEFSRRRIRSINKLIRVGRQEAVVVLRVDRDKGYIDLSKRRVSPEDLQRAEDKYTKSKTVHSIFRHVAETLWDELHITLEQLYQSVGWPLYRRYGHAYDALKAAISDQDQVFQGIQFPHPKVFETLMSNVRHRLTPQPVKLRCDVEVTCFGYEGIEAVRAALIDGERLSTEDFPMKIRLVAPPVYVLTATTLDRVRGLQTMEQAAQAIQKTIVERGGVFKLKMSPQVVSESDERDLSTLMNELSRQNLEVSGDDDVSDEEDNDFDQKTPDRMQ